MLTSSRRSLSRWIRYLHVSIERLMLAFLLFLVANTLIATGYQVSGKSMETTLHDGQYVLVWILGPVFRSPSDGELVVFSDQDDRRVRFIKRIAGVPGEIVTVGDRVVRLGSDEYYVLGDNRDHSTDSRLYGPIKKEQIIGYVTLLPHW